MLDLYHDATWGAALLLCVSKNEATVGKLDTQSSIRDHYAIPAMNQHPGQPDTTRYVSSVDEIASSVSYVVLPLGQRCGHWVTFPKCIVKEITNQKRNTKNNASNTQTDTHCQLEPQPFVS